MAGGRHVCAFRPDGSTVGCIGPIGLLPATVVYDLDVGNDAIVLGGMFYNTDDFDPSEQTDNHTSHGVSDVFVTTVVQLPIPLYGDLDGSGVVDVDDVLYVLGGFSDTEPCLNFPAANLVPCGEPCDQGQIDVSDILAVLDAFIGIAACPVPCPND